MSHNFCLLLITQQSYWSDLRGCIQFRLTLAILSIEIILVPSMTSHKGKVKCPHFIATKVPLIYIHIYKMQKCVWETRAWGSLFWTKSSASFFFCSRSELEYCSPSSWIGLHGRTASFWSSWSSTIWGPLECHVPTVCVDLSDVYACLSRTGQDILQQANTAHIIKGVILKSVKSPFILKPVSNWKVRHHIQYESKTLKEDHKINGGKIYTRSYLTAQYEPC